MVQYLLEKDLLFQTTKIQTFESNSQRQGGGADLVQGCFRLQRYKLLKAIHNLAMPGITRTMLFQTTKIQTFESNSQLEISVTAVLSGCFRLQRYKLLKAIHNACGVLIVVCTVVSDYKDTNF